VIGADERQLVAVAKALRAAKDKELTKAMRLATNAAVEPAKDAIRKGVGQAGRVPRRGGLAAVIAGAKFRVQRLGGKAPGIVLIMRRAKQDGGGVIDLKRMNAGRLRHPTWGNRDKWVTQTIPSGWFEACLEPVKPQVTDAMRAAVQDVANQIAAKSHGSGS
jgi:hypothetical protein